MKPKVSVLIPAYNTKEAYLRGAIESILNQTFTNFELIILNNGPKNETVENVILSYKDKRIKYIKNEENNGISHGRNQLIDLASGEYLAVMDHDDISLPNRLAEQVEFLDNNPEYGVVSAWFQRFPKKKIYKSVVEDEDIKLALMKHCVLLHPASMIRKSVLDKNNLKYEDEFSPAEDYALWCKLIPFTKFYNIPKVLFSYRVHATRASKIFAKKMGDATYKIHEFVREANPELYKTYMERQKNLYRVKLFGLIPFMSILKSGNTIKCKLFGIPIIYIKKKIGL